LGAILVEVTVAFLPMPQLPEFREPRLRSRSNVADNVAPIVTWTSDAVVTSKVLQMNSCNMVRWAQKIKDRRVGCRSLILLG
jgi:hypothetical protein